jgi:hypothetical protein
MPTPQTLAASFRDPSGFMFSHEGVLYRQINHHYRQDYDHLMESGLYAQLSAARLLIPHQEVSPDLAVSSDAYKVIQPDTIQTISYPYEWSFGQLKAAALTTLAVQKRAFEAGMTLKDSSAYNIQFVDGRPVLIDTLSFERYQAGTVWVAYRQFCQHFLAPLALMSYTDVRLSQLFRVCIDGIPLDMAAKLLPGRARWRLSLLLHIFLHARSQQRYRDQVPGAQVTARQVSRHAFLGLLDNLEAGIAKLQWKGQRTEWADYYRDDSYTAEGFAHKQQIVDRLITQANPTSVWDLGANTGVFSRLASQRGIPTVAWDVDPGAVELNFRQVRQDGDTNLLPLVLDLTNPSSALGWAHRERMSFAERGPVDLVMALALVHHLAISNNVPLDQIAQFLASLCQSLIIEFVPKSDKKVQTLLATRVDIFDHYTEAGFEKAFSPFFAIEQKEHIPASERVLYLMRVK